MNRYIEPEREYPWCELGGEFEADEEMLLTQPQQDQTLYDAIPGLTPEQQRQARVMAHEEMECQVCGCSEWRACEGGRIWPARFLCSRCARSSSEKSGALPALASA